MKINIFTGKNKNVGLAIRESIHEQLVGNEDYVNSNIGITESDIAFTNDLKDYTVQLGISKEANRKTLKRFLDIPLAKILKENELNRDKELLVSIEIEINPGDSDIETKINQELLNNLNNQVDSINPNQAYERLNRFSTQTFGLLVRDLICNQFTGNPDYINSEICINESEKFYSPDNESKYGYVFRVIHLNIFRDVNIDNLPEIIKIPLKCNWVLLEKD